jgi:hypothetical protein
VRRRRALRGAADGSARCGSVAQRRQSRAARRSCATPFSPFSFRFAAFIAVIFFAFGFHVADIFAARRHDSAARSIARRRRQAYGEDAIKMHAMLVDHHVYDPRHAIIDAFITLSLARYYQIIFIFIAIIFTPDITIFISIFFDYCLRHAAIFFYFRFSPTLFSPFSPLPPLPLSRHYYF